MEYAGVCEEVRGGSLLVSASPVSSSLLSLWDSQSLRFCCHSSVLCKPRVNPSKFGG